jgi:Cys-tRNA(Pro)/Cys-tRNA(Cys) deacylase
MAARGTPATDALRRERIAHRLHEYEVATTAGRNRTDRPTYGLEAAAALGVDPAQMFKTLVATVDGRLALAIVPVAGELDLKRLADALAGRRAAMADPAEAERATGYVVGGISPIGGRRKLPTALDDSALGFDSIYVSSGRRGLQLELAPGDLARATDAIVASIARV